ncbi:MAG: hypothetical protein HYX28_01525 [Candidatus Koribacter versatilis]|uniref:Uncharacterized protein n=1 Tax=Candidatus Korobacter versatilis TaxID=658062 RepID=A0A932A682_9BACT|nr:hypothetical protein [Candidatus Koribacter versatilis]
MLMEKIRHGVLQVATDHGARFVAPSLVERLRLMWMFRNFKLLPQEVLSQHEQALVRHLCERQLEKRQDVSPDAVIGIVEQQPTFPPKKRPVATARVHQHTA